MGRKNGLPTTYDLFIIGEQLRCQMTSVGLIKDTRHHLRKHRQCFVAKDAIDWILKMHHVDTRQEAVDAMFILQEFNVIRHVTDDQEFKDKNSLFRFTKDDATYRADRELMAFYRGLEIYDMIKKKGKDVLRNIYFKGDLQSNVFHGDDLVDFLQEWEGTLDRQEVVEELKDLLTRDVIKHLSDDCHFVDDRICYKFNIDFYKSCLLHEVLEIMEYFNSITVNKSKERSTPSDKDYSDEAEDDSTDVEASAEDMELLPSPLPPSRPRKVIPAPRSESTRSVGLIKKVDSPVSKRQDYSSQNQNERILLLTCDNLGFGLTLRGTSPCYVHSVAPLGPAAKAKVKVGHSVSSVNGQSVLHMDHKSVGTLIAQCEAGSTPLRLGVSLNTRRRQS